MSVKNETSRKKKKHFSRVTICQDECLCLCCCKDKNTDSKMLYH